MSRRNLTTSILGDSGATEATVVPNLETLNTGNDNYLTAISDTSEFNVYQQMKIYDNFWDTQFAEHIVNSVNGGSIVTNAVIQGNTEGWVRADHMCVSVPFEIKYDVRTMDNLNDVTTLTHLNEGRSALSRYLSDIRLQAAYHPRYAFIDCFNRFKVLLGNNGQQIQKTAETQPLGLKHHMAHHRYGKEVAAVQALWGMKNSHTRLMTTNYSTAIPAMEQNLFGRQAYPSCFYNQLEAHYDLLKTWAEDDESMAYVRFLQQGVSPLYDNISAQNQAVNITPLETSFKMPGMTAAVTNPQRRSIVVTTLRTLTLPLQSIIPFFRGAKYLPPDFRFKFELESNSTKYVVQSSRAFEDMGCPIRQYPQNQMGYGSLGAGLKGYYSSNQITIDSTYSDYPFFPVGFIPSASDGAAIDTKKNPFQLHIYPEAYNKDFFITARMRLGDVKFMYPWHILRQPVQAAISSMWLQKPFLYNYETTELLENVFIDGQTTVNIQVAISAQRPTVITAYLVPVASQFFGEANCNQAEIFGQTFAESALFRPIILNETTAGGSVEVFKTGGDTDLKGNTTVTLWGGYGSVDPYKHAVMIADSPCRWAQAMTPTSPPAQWSDLEIRFSGRTGYRFKNDYTGARLFGNVNTDTQNFMCSLWTEQSYRTYGTEVNNDIKSASDNHFNGLHNWNGINGNELINLVIQPGGWTDRGIISSRQGATTIQLVITFKTPLSNKTKLCVFRTNPEQLVFDSDKNVTIIQWPAVKNNSGYLLPNVTAAP